MFGIFNKKNEDVVSNNPVSEAVYFFEDYSAKTLTEERVGRKGLSLFSLKDMDVPVSGFFVICPEIYKDVVFRAFDKNIVTLLENDHLPEPKQLSEYILRTKFDALDQDDILRAYSRLSGFSDSWVSVRSSVVFPERPDVSFNGVFSTELNIRGFDNLLEAIKTVYASIFTDKLALYAKSQGINLTHLKMAVVVQKMVQAEVSGIVYTIDPVTDDLAKMSIETIFGLGDVITSGELTPDRYLLNKSDLSFIEKQIAPQEWMRVRTLVSKKVGQHFGSAERIQISSNWSHQQKLEDRFVEDVAKVALIIEEKAGEPQDIEWVWESGNVWILQAKPIHIREIANIVMPLSPMQAMNTEKTESEIELKEHELINADLIDMAAQVVKDVKREELEAVIEEVKEFEPVQVIDEPGSIITDVYNTDNVNNEDTLLNKDFAQIPFTQEDQKFAIDELENLDFELKKLSELLVVKDLEKYQQEINIDETLAKVEELQIEKEELLGVQSDSTSEMELVCSGQGSSFGISTGEVKIIHSDFDLKDLSSTILTKRNILVLEDYNKDLEKIIFAVGGVILKTGGLTSDVAVLCRELNIPAVVGVGQSISLFEDGQLVQIDGNFGSIYRVITPISKIERLVTDRLENPNENSEKLVLIEALENTIQEEKVRDEQIHKTVEELIQNSVIKEEVKEAFQDNIAKLQVEKLFTATKVFTNHSPILSMEQYKEVVRISDGIVVIDLDQLLLSHGKHPMEATKEGNAKNFTEMVASKIDEIAILCPSDEVVISIGSANVDDFRRLPNGHTFEDSAHAGTMSGAARLLKNTNYLKKVIAIFKKVRNSYRNKNVSLAIHAPMNSRSITEIKKEFGASGLRRSSTFNVYALIENPAEVLLADDLLTSEIDGIIMNMHKLACDMQGLDFNDKSARYDMSTSSVLRLVDNVMASVKKSRKNVIVICENNRTLVKHAIRQGVYGVSVYPEIIAEMRKVVAEEEASIVLGKR